MRIGAVPRRQSEGKGFGPRVEDNRLPSLAYDYAHWLIVNVIRHLLEMTVAHHFPLDAVRFDKKIICCSGRFE